MRRTDRLFDLIQILRDGRLHTARDMAGRLEVSTRTLWRDMATLIAGGLPVEGERGVGYILREPITLPPLTLTEEETEALILALRLLAEGADPGMAGAVERLSGKIMAVLPASRATRAEPPVWIFPGEEALAAARHLPDLRRAIRLGAVMELAYADGEGRKSRREVRPLVLEFWGRVWTLAAWCETRGDFRSFRVDRIASLHDTGRVQAPEAGRDLAAWRARMGISG
ncbi:YafY family transcriptional regulator [Rhodobacter sp. HX-7-19]|uniref:YafY family transcriptional regulator n=1 Tax=Paragemmobacter kunshanensis TaxID=2583234 RepID=A0A6M1TW73_9RHOB|nr:YafY family protein [Rhodobacter kunshanensis]NGQ92588.1 YafY family transcriptional regulator [Rhodobacter kunshanensis]